MEKTKSKIWQALAAFALCFAIILTFGACGEPTENKNEITAEEIETATTTLSNASETFKEIETKKEQNELNFFTQTEQVTNGASLGLSKEFYDEKYVDIDADAIESNEVGSVSDVLRVMKLLNTKELEFNKLYVDKTNNATYYFEINKEEKNVVCNMAAGSEESSYAFQKTVVNFTSNWSDWESIEATGSREDSYNNKYYMYVKAVNSTNKNLRPYFDSWTQLACLEDGNVYRFFDLNLIAGKYYNLEGEAPAELTTAVVNKVNSINYEEQEKEIKSKCVPFTIINFSELVKGE
ncbi:MAG: hypothetical protein IJ837_01460 [Clostridia bacterium]|nr:hypothetical protein [Clostridia bacterium]